MLLEFLHIAMMFSAVAVAIGGELILTRAAATRTSRPSAGRLAPPAPGRASSLFLFLLGALVGVIAVLICACNLLALWLIIAYVLFVIAMGIGAQIGAWAQRVGMAAAASPEDAPSAQLSAAIDDPRAVIFRYANWVIVIALIFVMVYKPGS